jgi:hypothetical protein
MTSRWILKKNKDMAPENWDKGMCDTVKILGRKELNESISITIRNIML